MQGSKKEWQQQGDWQVPLVGTQTEPLLQQDYQSRAVTEPQRDSCQPKAD